MTDDDALVYLNGIIEFCEDKLYEMGQYGGSDEEEDDLDLREFDDLEEDDETW